MIAYKAFEHRMSSRGYWYTVGGTYTHDGIVEVCRSGFHACNYPLDVLMYYPATSKFAVVDCSGDIDEDVDGTKFACETMHFQRELDPIDLAKQSLKYIRENYKDRYAVVAGRCVSSTFLKSAAVSSECRATATTTGARSVAYVDNYNSVAIATGAGSAALADGECVVAVSTASSSISAASGSHSATVTTGELSHAYTNGRYSIAATVNYKSLAQSTYSHSAAVAIDNRSKAICSSHESVALTINHGSSAEVLSMYSVACALGKNSKAKASKGSAIVCVYRDEFGTIDHIKSSLVGENGIKPDTWYTLNEHGEFVECQD